MMDEVFCIPLKQHIGAPSVAIVKAGDEVIKGQKIACIKDFGANIHSSVSGKVLDVTPTNINILPYGSQPDESERIPALQDPLSLIEEAGIVGAGGAGFPTHLKYRNLIEGGTIIANGAECEPLHTHNVVQIRSNPISMIKGLRYAMKITQASQGVIAIKEKHVNTRKVLQSMIGNDKQIVIELLPNKYPIGEERALIKEIFGIELPPDELPFNRGFLVSNVETLMNVSNAIEGLMPVSSKNLTVAMRINGKAEAKSAFGVPIGVKIANLLQNFGGISEPFGEIIVNGPLMGIRANLSTPITKVTNSIIVTQPFPTIRKPFGLLICACGGSEYRLKEIVNSMEGWVVSSIKCKQVVEVGESMKCEKPGHCPGQAEKVLELKKNGAEAVLLGTCTECSQTVMEIAPKLGIDVFHQADHVLKSFGFNGLFYEYNSSSIGLL